MHLVSFVTMRLFAALRGSVRKSIRFNLFYREWKWLIDRTSSSSREEEPSPGQVHVWYLRFLRRSGESRPAVAMRLPGGAAAASEGGSLP
ncbi:hypothetical protein E2C01_101262 [Portunus trituberculatus]|uniref:Uncharacterized protein n=1 Tax=Portunus trituberculatus TaxID=210409 RepID=A0A5B7KLI7_PORTR|nr:hypothetical protein [Portunus trituberculatus]